MKKFLENPHIKKHFEEKMDMTKSSLYPSNLSGHVLFLPQLLFKIKYFGHIVD